MPGNTDLYERFSKAYFDSKPVDSRARVQKLLNGEWNSFKAKHFVTAFYQPAAKKVTVFDSLGTRATKQLRKQLFVLFTQAGSPVAVDVPKLQK